MPLPRAGRMARLVDLAFQTAPECLWKPDAWMAELEEKLLAAVELETDAQVSLEEAEFLDAFERCMARRNGLWGVPSWGWLVGAVGLGALLGFSID